VWPLRISSTATGSWLTLAAITVGSVSATIGCSWASAALVCSGTATAPIWASAMSMVVKSTLLKPSTATRSPGCTGASARARASAPARSPSSP
jgi:hypothetical protein